MSSRNLSPVGDYVPKSRHVLQYAAAFLIAYLCFLLLRSLNIFKSFSKREMEVKQIITIS